MQISERGKRLIKFYEGCRLTAYRCPSGTWTIGYGHTGSVYAGMQISQKEAEKLFDNDINNHCYNVSRLVKVKLNQNQFDALVSLEYNIGYGNFRRSSVLRYINVGQFYNAAWCLYHENTGSKTKEEKYKGCWVFDNNKKVLPGLVRRRKAEMDLFIS